MIEWSATSAPSGWKRTRSGASPTASKGHWPEVAHENRRQRLVAPGPGRPSTPLEAADLVAGRPAGLPSSIVVYAGPSVEAGPPDPVDDRRQAPLPRRCSGGVRRGHRLRPVGEAVQRGRRRAGRGTPLHSGKSRQRRPAPTVRRPGPETHLDVTRRAHERDPARVDPQVHAAHARVQQETSEPHYHMALYGTYYNFCRVHRSLQITPAMEAGLADKARDVSWIVELIEENTPAPGPRGPYRRRECPPSSVRERSPRQGAASRLAP